MKEPQLIDGEVKNIVSELLDIPQEEIHDDSHFSNDLGADSLDKAELILDLEKKYDINISDEIAEQIVYFEDLVKGVGKLIDNETHQIND
tara:strand:- start:154 stop:423 length:270 start_codon:yes stop_codon:yes gene_type:complete